MSAPLPLLEEGETVRRTEWLVFVYLGQSESGKTQEFSVRGHTGDVLGHVVWFGRWRQYAFQPDPGTTYNDGCLRDIAQFCADRSALHRLSRRGARA